MMRRMVSTLIHLGLGDRTIGGGGRFQRLKFLELGVD